MNTDRAYFGDRRNIHSTRCT